MRKIKALALLTTIAVVSAGVCACGGKKAEETTAMKEETKQAQAKADDVRRLKNPLPRKNRFKQTIKGMQIPIIQQTQKQVAQKWLIATEQI